MRAHIRVAHRLCKPIPLGLRNSKQQVRTREHGVLAPARVFERAIDDAPRRFGQLIHWIEKIVDVHGNLHPSTGAERTSPRSEHQRHHSAHGFLLREKP